jgi:transposase
MVTPKERNDMGSTTDSDIDPVAVLEFFSNNYTAAARMPSNRELERYLILRSKVELALLASLTGKNSIPWKERFEDRGNELNFSVALRNFFACPNEPPDGRQFQCARDNRGCAWKIRNGAERDRLDSQNAWDKKDRGTWEILPEEGHFGLNISLPLGTRRAYPLGTILFGKHELPYPLGERAGGLQRDRQSLADFLYRAYSASKSNSYPVNKQLDPRCIEKCLEVFADGMTKIVQEADTGQVGVRLLHLLCLVHGFETEREGVTYVANCLKISDSLYSFRGWLDGRRGWHQHEEMFPLGEGELPEDTEDDVAWFAYGRNKKGYITQTIFRDTANKVILPVTAWTHERAGFRFYLNLPPHAPLLTNLPAILGNRDARIIVTSSIEIAVPNGARQSDEEVVWTTWYGEAEAVPLIDWACLKGREVFYLIAPDPHCPPESACDREYDTAHAVCEELSDLRGVRLVFVEMRAELAEGEQDRDPFEGAAVWSPDEFAEVYRRHRLLGRPPAKPGQFAPLSMKQLVAGKPILRPFVLAPIIAEKSITLMYARTGIGKTWVALSLAAAVAHGTVLFGQWRAEKPRKVLYVDSEMTSQSLGARIDVVSRMMFDGKRLPRKHHANFLSISRNRSTSDVEEFKKEVAEYVAAEGVELVVLDNLTAFTQHNDSAKAWEETHIWVDALRESDCALLIIHHENRAGGQRGTSATTNAVDNVLHLVDPEVPRKDGDELVMKVKVEKGRDIHGAARRPFLAVIAPNARRPYCKREELPKTDSDYVEHVDNPTTADEKGASGRAYRRTKAQKEELQAAAIAKLAEGLSVEQTADALGVSRSRIYRISGLTDSDQFKALGKGRMKLQKGRESRVFEKSRKKETVRRICEDEKMSASAVRRMIDAGWTGEIEEHLQLPDRWWVEAVADGAWRDLKMASWQPKAVAEKIECDPKTVARLMEKMRLRIVPELRSQSMTSERIAEELGADLAHVQAVCRREDRKAQKARRREHELEKVNLLHRKGHSKSQIIGLVDLPLQTVTVELNRLRREELGQSTKS